MNHPPTVTSARADIFVQDVQIWLNSTYGGVNGFELVPTTGKTGWSTMYALTRALQHELGIVALSNNFGETTMRELEAVAPSIGPSTRDERMVRLVQGGLYCKGYNPGGFDGDFGAGTASAVSALKEDMGFGTSAAPAVTPKIFKALLTMDAYVVLPGGSATARSVQQWLNSRYINRKSFQVMPCDGLYSRNTQRALVYALQYELGMTDSVANGTFGPGTRSGLEAQATFGSGAQDGAKNWVRLFHAALIFNKRVVAFDATFSASDSSEVRAFQEFCRLDANGRADYRTWCSLLVSNGDPSRPGTACDTRVRLSPSMAAALRGAGYTTVGRYLSNARVAKPLDKQLAPGELGTIFASGLSAFPIYQEIGSTASNFSYIAGLDAGYRADSAARSFGVPAGTSIYFAVDFDPTDDQIDAFVLPHFRGVRDALARRGERYRPAAYGTRNVCARLDSASLSNHSFVSGMSTGYSGNLGYPLPANWSFDQIFEYTLTTGLPVDKNIASGRDVGFSTTVSPSPRSPNSRLLEFLLWLEVKATEYIAGIPGTSYTTAQLMCQFLRRNPYGGTQWSVVIQPLNTQWISFASSRLEESGMEEVTSYQNYLGPDEPDTAPSPFDINHLAAALEGYLYHGLPESSTDPSSAEIAGWAADLVSVLTSFYLARRADPALTLDTYARDTIGVDRPDVYRRNALGWQDLVMDVDAFAIAHAIQNSSVPSVAELIVSQVNQRGTSSSTSRFADFIENRFSGADNMRSCALKLLGPTPPLSAEISAKRIATLALGDGAVLSMGDFTDAELRDLAGAFADRVEALA